MVIPDFLFVLGQVRGGEGHIAPVPRFGLVSGGSTGGTGGIDFGEAVVVGICTEPGEFFCALGGGEICGF